MLRESALGEKVPVPELDQVPPVAMKAVPFRAILDVLLHTTVSAPAFTEIKLGVYVRVMVSV